MATKDSMARAYAAYVGLPLHEAKEDWDLFCDFMGDTLKSGEEFTVHGICSLGIEVQPDRQYRNPKTGEPVFTPAHYVPKIKFTPAFKKAVREIPVE